MLIRRLVGILSLALLVGCGDDALIALKSNAEFSPLALHFGAVMVGDSHSVPVRLDSTGLRPLKIDRWELDGDFTVKEDLAKVFAEAYPPSSYAELTILFVPERAGRHDGKLTVFSGDREWSLVIDGDGIAAPPPPPPPPAMISCAPNPVEFGAIPRGRTEERTVTCAVDGQKITVGSAELRETDTGFTIVQAPQAETFGSGEDFKIDLNFTAAGTISSRTSTLLLQWTATEAPEMTGMIHIPLNASVDMPPPTETFISAVLTWDTEESDVDIHLVQPGGTVFVNPGDCRWNNRTPDWGVPNDDADNPFLDVDDRDGLGPERLNLNNGEVGRYEVYVHYYKRHDILVTTTNATVELHVNGDRVGSFQKAFECRDLWHVGSIDRAPDGSAIFTAAGNLTATLEGTCSWL